MSAATLCWAQPALAEWRKAESDHFIVYSQGNERDLRRYVRNLEFYDHLLRFRYHLPADDQIRRKLPIYLVNRPQGLREVYDGGPDVAGTYFPTTEDIFATAIQTTAQDFLLHEYYHHFSFQLTETSSYPAWLIEGMAEYYMTAEIRDDTIMVGGYNENRVFALFEANWLSLEDLLTKRYREVRGERRATYYPVAWLLTHWFQGDPRRSAQLLDYLAALRAGEDPVQAMERVTGLSMTQLRSRLSAYRVLPTITYPVDFPEPEMTVTVLPPSADSLLLIGQRLKVGVAEEKRAETAELVRRLAARFPDDPFALLQLGHAELHFGDPEAGEAALTRLLEVEPDNVEALQYMASRYIKLASESPDDSAALLRRARQYLARAYAADENAYYTLQMLASSRQHMPDYPNENDLVTWDRAFRLAPQLPGIRLGYASALMQVEDHDIAIAILEPLANAAHGGDAAQAATQLLERARRRGSPPSEATLKEAIEASDGPSEPAEPPAPEGDAPAPAPEAGA